jgi:hypothetical protein
VSELVSLRLQIQILSNHTTRAVRIFVLQNGLSATLLLRQSLLVVLLLPLRDSQFAIELSSPPFAILPLGVLLMNAGALPDQIVGARVS